MEETYCIKDKIVTPCVEPCGYQSDKNGRKQFYCHCAICGKKKVRYVKNNGLWKKSLNKQQGQGIATDIGGVAVRLNSIRLNVNHQCCGQTKDLSLSANILKSF